MLLQLTIDKFLDELIEVYASIAYHLNPDRGTYRVYNPQYKLCFEYYQREKLQLYRYVDNGFFVSDEARHNVIDSLETALSLLATIGPDGSLHISNRMHSRLIIEIVRLLEMSKSIDVLEEV